MELVRKKGSEVDVVPQRSMSALTRAFRKTNARQIPIPHRSTDRLSRTPDSVSYLKNNASLKEL